MKNTNTRLKISALALLAGLYSAGAVAETASGVATANVIEPLIIDNLVAMAFGDIAAGTVGGTITMASGGALSATGDADIVGPTTGTPLTFDITGEAGQACTMTVSDGVLSDGGTESMAIATNDPACPALTGGGTADSVEVIGVLTLAGSQAAGAYSTASAGGTPITITANYD